MRPLDLNDQTLQNEQEDRDDLTEPEEHHEIIADKNHKFKEKQMTNEVV